MKMEFEYKTDTPNFKVETSNGCNNNNVPVIALKIEGHSGRSRKEAMGDYLVNLEYLFRELKLQYETDIESIKVSNTLVGDLLKNRHQVLITPNGEKTDFSKYNTIIYSFTSDTFIEKFILTANKESKSSDGSRVEDGIKRNGTSLNYSGYDVNIGVMDNEENAKKNLSSSKFVHSLSVSVNQLLNYKIHYDAETNKIKYAYKGSIIEDIDEIKDDDVFLFFKFVELLVRKDTHFGVFFIDASLLSPQVLKALIAFINLNYLNRRLIFLYNLPNNFGEKYFPCDIIELPNHKLSMEVKSRKQKK